MRNFYAIFCQQVVNDRGPIGKTVASELNPLAFKLACSILAAVVDEIVTLAQVFAVSDDHALVENIVKILRHPPNFVRRCGVVFPRCGGENVEVEVLLQLVHGFDGTRHGAHPGKESGYLVPTTFVSLERFLALLSQSGFEIYKDAVHVHKDTLREMAVFRRVCLIVVFVGYGFHIALFFNHFKLHAEPFVERMLDTGIDFGRDFILNLFIDVEHGGSFVQHTEQLVHRSG